MSPPRLFPSLSLGSTVVLTAGLVTSLGTRAATDAPCPPQKPRVVLERFVPADCAVCWSATPPNPTPDRDALVLDWIVPAPPGVEAPLAAAALIEAAPRAARDGRLDRDETLVQSHPLPARTALSLLVQDGPALNGYIGLQMTVRFASKQPLPEGISAWIALVERIPAREDDSPVDRQLVRSVAGPIPLVFLQRDSVEHLRAVRVPESGKPERLSAVGWVETAKGRVIAAASASINGCPAR